MRRAHFLLTGTSRPSAVQAGGEIQMEASKQGTWAADCLPGAITRPGIMSCHAPKKKVGSCLQTTAGHKPCCWLGLLLRAMNLQEAGCGSTQDTTRSSHPYKATPEGNWETIFAVTFTGSHGFHQGPMWTV